MTLSRLWLCWLLCVPFAGRAQITFSFTFADVTSNSGIGFADPVLGAVRRDALQSAASLLTNYFTGYSAITVPISVNVSGTDGSGALASAGASFFDVANSFQRNLVMKRIQDGGATSYSSLGVLNCDFGYSWSYGDTVSAGTYDFKAVVMHELLHTTGFGSYIQDNGTGQGSTTHATWSFYDQFLTDAAGNRLVTAAGVFNGGSILTNAVGSDVYFSGPHAMAANGGQRVHMYSPATFNQGSSLGHLDTDFFTSAKYVMEHSIAKGLSTRTLSAIELGILTDLGYSVTAVPEPGSVAVMAGVLSLSFAVWRRRVTAGRRRSAASTPEPRG